MSELIVEAIDQVALLSLAVATLRPVEISSWTLAMFLLMPFSVCRATIELVFVRIEDIGIVLLWRAAPSTPRSRVIAILTCAAGPLFGPVRADRSGRMEGTFREHREARVKAGGRTGPIGLCKNGDL